MIRTFFKVTKCLKTSTFLSKVYKQDDHITPIQKNRMMTPPTQKTNKQVLIHTLTKWTRNSNLSCLSIEENIAKFSSAGDTYSTKI